MTEYDYRFVSLRHISRSAYVGVWAGHFYHRLAAPFRASLAWFDRELGRLLADPDPRGFSLPVPFAVRALGGNVEFSVPARALSVNMYPWVVSRGRPLRVSHFFLGDGDWQPLLFPFNEGRIYREMGDLIAAGEGFRESAVFAELVRKAEEGKPERRNAVYLRTVPMIESYFTRYLGLVEAIREQGLLRIRELRRGSLKGGGVRLPISDWTEADIGVGINAEGGLVRLPDAQHRSAIAVHLDLPSVPVELRMIHLDWLRRMMDEFPGLTPMQALLAGFAKLRKALADPVAKIPDNGGNAVIGDDAARLQR